MLMHAKEKINIYYGSLLFFEYCFFSFLASSLKLLYYDVLLRIQSLLTMFLFIKKFMVKYFEVFSPK